MDRYARPARLAASLGLGSAVLAAVYFAFGAEPASGHHLCPNTGSPFGPFVIDTFEAGDYKERYARTFELGGYNDIAPEQASFALPGIETGPRSSGSSVKAGPYVPPVILKSIGFLESGWAQASYDPLVQYGEVGPVLSSHDCGYGLMQVTTGMQNISNVPTLDQSMIGTHYAFNIARGARILADKWNSAPEARPLVGSRKAHVIEDWYYALWGYNGFAYSNHPLNPAYQVGRVGYSCAPPGDGYGHDRTQYPYQELVFGCIERPPVRSGTELWNSIGAHLPDLSSSAFAGPLSTNNWNECAYSLDCAAMDIPTPNSSHGDPAAPAGTREELMGVPTISLSKTTVDVELTASAPMKIVQFKVSNSGTGVLGYRALATASWLDVTGGVSGVALGDELGGSDGVVTALIDVSGMASGQHTAKVTVNSHYASNPVAQFTVRVFYGIQPPPAPTTAKWGDNNCSGGAPNYVDGLLALRHHAGLNVSTGTCPPMGTVLDSGFKWGDIDCDSNVEATDLIKTMQYANGEPIVTFGNCPAMGSTVVIDY